MKTIWIVLNERSSGLQEFWNVSGFPFFFFFFTNTVIQEYLEKQSLHSTLMFCLPLTQRPHCLSQFFDSSSLSPSAPFFFSARVNSNSVLAAASVFCFFLKVTCPVLFPSHPPILPPSFHLCPSLFPSGSSLLVFRIWWIILSSNVWKFPIISFFSFFFLCFFH